MYHAPTNTFSAELTFIPNRSPYHFKGKNGMKKAAEICNKINETLVSDYKYAKVDPFYIYDNVGQLLNEDNWSFCIEIVPLNEKGFDDLDEIIYFNKRSSMAVQWTNELIAKLKKDYKLITHKVVNNKHYPTGGGHIHYSITNLFDNNINFLSKLDKFQRLLYIDLYNRPYIPWLFRQWFDNNNAIITQPISKESQEFFSQKCLVDDIINTGLNGNCIVPRFQSALKTSYTTYEFRFFDMVKNGEELHDNVKFIDVWLKSLRSQAEMGVDICPELVTLTDGKFKEYQTIRGGKKACKKFIEELGLDWSNYEEKFNINYKNRIKYGEPL